MFYIKKICLISFSLFAIQTVTAQKNYPFPIHQAIKEGNIKKLNTYIQKQYDLSQNNRKAETPLHFAIRKRKYKCAYVLMRSMTDVNLTTAKEQTPLHFAAKYGLNYNIARQLVYYNADLEAEDFQGKTALHLAAETGNASIVKYLVEQGANQYAYDFLGQRPIDLAKAKGHSEVLLYLKK